MKRTETGTERGAKKENRTQSEQVFISIPLWRERHGYTRTDGQHSQYNNLERWISVGEYVTMECGMIYNSYLLCFIPREQRKDMRDEWK